MWKTRLGQCIYESHSGFKVYQNAWYRWLTLGSSALQTLINRRHPEFGGLPYIAPLAKMAQAFPGDCCLLGLGGAGVVHTLSPALQHSHMTAVDNSQEIIAIATQYFKTEQLKNLTIIHQNAQDFVQSTPSLYQHILVDLYNAQDYPIECSNASFFAHCKALLKPEGIMAINLTEIQNKLPIFQRIQDAFNQCTLMIPIKGTTNTLIFACNTPLHRTFLDNIQNKQLLKRLVWDSVWGCIGQFHKRRGI